MVAACAASCDLAGFGRVEIVVGGESWAVALADDAAERSRGLMGITDLGGLRGMLFVFAGDTTSGFWMKGTSLPLDVAFFASDGSLVDLIEMAPCPAGDCPTYRAAGPYRYALEVPAGGFAAVASLCLDPASLPGSRAGPDG